VDKGLLIIMATVFAADISYEMQALSSFWHPLWRMVFYAALFRTQHWLEHNEQALLASAPQMMEEIVPRMRESRRKLQKHIRQVRSVLEADTGGQYSDVIRLLTEEDQDIGDRLAKSLEHHPIIPRLEPLAAEDD
jgi:hypothetical protein